MGTAETILAAALIVGFSLAAPSAAQVRTSRPPSVFTP